MDINSLSPEDKLSVFELCRASGTDSSDPMTLFYLEWVKLRREMLDIARGKKEGIEHAAQDLREQAIGIGSTLQIQKEVAQVLDQQLRWVKFAKNKILAGSFIAGAVVTGVVFIGAHRLNPGIDEKVAKLGAVISVEETKSSLVLAIDSTLISKAERTPDGVKVFFKR